MNWRGAVCRSDCDLEPTHTNPRVSEPSHVAQDISCFALWLRSGGGADFGGADLNGAGFRWAGLRSARLPGANLREADRGGAACVYPCTATRTAGIALVICSVWVA